MRVRIFFTKELVRSEGQVFENGKHALALRFHLGPIIIKTDELEIVSVDS